VEVERQPEVGGRLVLDLLDDQAAEPGGRAPVDAVDGVAGRVVAYAGGLRRGVEARGVGGRAAGQVAAGQGEVRPRLGRRGGRGPTGRRGMKQPNGSAALRSIGPSW